VYFDCFSLFKIRNMPEIKKASPESIVTLRKEAEKKLNGMSMVC